MLIYISQGSTTQMATHPPWSWVMQHSTEGIPERLKGVLGVFRQRNNRLIIPQETWFGFFCHSKSDPYTKKELTAPWQNRTKIHTISKSAFCTFFPVLLSPFFMAWIQCWPCFKSRGERTRWLSDVPFKLNYPVSVMRLEIQAVRPILVMQLSTTRAELANCKG